MREISLEDEGLNPTNSPQRDQSYHWGNFGPDSNLVLEHKMDLPTYGRHEVCAEEMIHL